MPLGDTLKQHIQNITNNQKVNFTKSNIPCLFDFSKVSRKSPGRLCFGTQTVTFIKKSKKINTCGSLWKSPGSHQHKQSSNKDKQMITRLTVDTKETKENIRKAAVYARRWGAAGRHTVFLRDTLPEKAAQKRGRSSSNEDTKTPKK